MRRNPKIAYITAQAPKSKNCLLHCAGAEIQKLLTSLRRRRNPKIAYFTAQALSQKNQNRILYLVNVQFVNFKLSQIKNRI